MEKKKICYTNTYFKFWVSKSWEISPTLFPWNLKEENGNSLFYKFMIILIYDAEIGLDFLITHHDNSVMKLADV